MDKRRQKLKKLGFVSQEEHKSKVYGQKGSSKREQYEKDLKIEVLGDFLKELRTQKNLTQEQLAELMNIDKSYISKIENNLKETNVGIMQSYLEALKVSKMSIQIDFEDGQSEKVQLI